MMDEQSFRRYAAIYGGDLSRWPAELLPAVAVTLKQNPAMDRILQDELTVDAGLNAIDVAPVSAGLRARIMAIPERFPLPSPMVWLSPKRLVPTLLLCSMLGLLVGANDPIQQAMNQRRQSAWIFAPEQTLNIF
jgi:hypothetical protein